MSFGKRIADYRHSPAAFIKLGGFFIVLGVMVGLFGPPQDRVTVLSISGVVLALCMMGPIFVARRSIEEYEKGLVFRNGASEARVAWSDVVGVVGALSRSGSERFLRLTLHTKSGARHGFGAHLVGYPTLARRTLSKMRERFLAQAQRARAGGDPVVLGPIRIERDALRIRDQAIAWSDISSVELEENEVVILRRGQRFAAARLDDVPNAMFLHEVVKAPATAVA